MLHRLLILFSFLLLTGTAVATENVCPEPEGCAIKGDASGNYHMALARNGAGASGRQKVVVFFHGHGGSGASVIRNAGLVRSFTDRGYVFVAPDGAAVPGAGRRGWPARDGLANARNNIAFVEAMLDDISARLGGAELDVLLSGFSSGGSMAWYFACHSKSAIGAVVAVAGGLRRPIPQEKCPAGPRRMLHIHGFADNQVPLEGRAIRAWHQGDVFEGLAVQRRTNICQSKPDAITTRGSFWCRDWKSCESGKPVSFCLHRGGHSLPKGWAERAMNWHSKS